MTASPVGMARPRACEMSPHSSTSTQPQINVPEPIQPLAGVDPVSVTENAAEAAKVLGETVAVGSGPPNDVGSPRSTQLAPLNIARGCMASRFTATAAKSEGSTAKRCWPGRSTWNSRPRSAPRLRGRKCVAPASPGRRRTRISCVSGRERGRRRAQRQKRCATGRPRPGFLPREITEYKFMRKRRRARRQPTQRLEAAEQLSPAPRPRLTPSPPPPRRWYIAVPGDPARRSVHSSW